MRKKDVNKALDLLLNGKALIGNTGQSIIFSEDFKKILKKLRGKKKEKPIKEISSGSIESKTIMLEKYRKLTSTDVPPNKDMLDEFGNKLYTDGKNIFSEKTFQELQEGSPFDYKAKVKFTEKNYQELQEGSPFDPDYKDKVKKKLKKD